jgi:hypothetical protein
MGFSKEEGASWKKRVPEKMIVDCSTTAYWYQTEPHKTFGPFPSYTTRLPVNVTPKPMTPSTINETLNIVCDNGRRDVVYLAKGWDFVFEQGVPGRMSRKEKSEKRGDVECWCDNEDLKVKLICPKGASGKLMLHLVDADQKGRVEQVFVGGREMGTHRDFGDGKWVDLKIDKTMTEGGSIDLDMKPLAGQTAVVSGIRFETD